LRPGSWVSVGEEKTEVTGYRKDLALPHTPLDTVIYCLQKCSFSVAVLYKADRISCESFLVLLVAYMTPVLSKRVTI